MGGTDWRMAGQRADATRVTNMVADTFRNPAKDAIRSWVIHELKAASPTLVLDLWGGGRSATELTEAGLSVLSVDDGRALDRVSRRRVERAMAFAGEADGYRTGYGTAAKYAPECDAAWLDFMGHLSGETVRTLTACRHMKALAITLMPDRMAGVRNLPLESWAITYRANIEHYSEMRIASMRKYRRPSGQWVIVFFARRASQRQVRFTTEQRRRYAEKERARRASPEYRAKVAAQDHSRYTSDPEHRARMAARQRARLADPAIRAAKREADRQRRTTPEYRALVAEQRRRIKLTDPERHAHNLAMRRLRKAARKLANPEYQQKLNAQQRARYAADPEWRAHVNAKNRVRSAIKMADPEWRALKNAKALAWRSNPENLVRERARERDRERYAHDPDYRARRLARGAARRLKEYNERA